VDWGEKRAEVLFRVIEVTSALTAPKEFPEKIGPSLVSYRDGWSRTNHGRRISILTAGKIEPRPDVRGVKKNSRRIVTEERAEARDRTAAELLYH
jgi:hypothetical protein